MPSGVRAGLDLHLEEGMTYIYQITQTQVMQVTVISASHISFPSDSRGHIFLTGARNFIVTDYEVFGIYS